MENNNKPLIDYGIDFSKVAMYHDVINDIIKVRMPLPEIVDFDTIFQTDNKDEKEYAVSIMKFKDGTQTKCMIDLDEDDHDAYVAFLTCYCKKILGKDFNKTWNYWTNVRPRKMFKEAVRELVAKEEAAEAAKRRKERNERKRYRRLVKEQELLLRAQAEALANLGGDGE